MEIGVENEEYLRLSSPFIARPRPGKFAKVPEGTESGELQNCDDGWLEERALQAPTPEWIHTSTGADRFVMDIALFSPSSLFANEDGSSSDDDKSEAVDDFVERTHSFPGMDLSIREFAFHQLNANLLWPGTFAFADWLVEHRSWLDGRKIIELGSGTGALAIFLQKSFQVDITTSDYDDQDIGENIAYNCTVNGITPPLPHIKHSWGDAFPVTRPEWDLILASDILLYVKQYPNLIKTLSFLLKPCKVVGNQSSNLRNEDQSGGTPGGLPSPAFLMSWRRRIGKEDESLFFTGCKDAGFDVQHLGSRVYWIVPGKLTEEGASIGNAITEN